jgi:hypothetical protein
VGGGKVYFVRPDGATYGNANGSSWSNAWSGFSKINWNQITPGTAICLAGGSYSQSLSPQSSGNSANPIVIKRALTSDPQCGSGTESWTSSFDSQIVMSNIIEIGTSYITIDGTKANGISVTMQNPTDSDYAGIAGDVGPTSYVTIRNIEVAGPCGSTACAQNNDQRSVELEHWNGSDYDKQDNWIFQNMNIHGACNNFVLYGATNLTVENSRMADSATTNTANCHPNVVNDGSPGPVTWRWNEITNWQVEGIMFLQKGTWYVYGNNWHDPMSGSYPRVMESQTSAMQVYFYNNTIANDSYYSIIDTANGGSWSSTSQGRNNIYWNDTQGGPNLPSDDYDYSDQSLSGETHGQGNAPNPFVSSGSQNYRLIKDTNAGLTLSSPYNIDYDGNTRGANGVWDRGAFQFFP